MCFSGYLGFRFIRKSQKNIGGQLNDSVSTGGATNSTALPNKKSFKMMTYQEALEASKQFIYNITKAVMQKFTPDAQQTLLDLGKNLVKSGVTYLHVVDVAALSAEKEKQLSHMQQKEQSPTASLGKK